MAKDTLKNSIDALITAVEKIASHQAAPIAPIAPIAPLAPVHSGDHDLLITLVAKVDGVKEDIRVLNDGTSAKISDHETRLRALEKIQESSSGTMSITTKIVFGAVGIVLTAVMSGLVFLVVRMSN